MQLKTYEWGDPGAPPLVCMHGVGEHHGDFRHVAEDRWAAKFRVIAVDFRGHGASGWGPPWDDATHVADILDTLDALELEEANLVGFSFGGRLVLELAARAPERVRRGVALEPVIQIAPELALRRAQEELTGDVWGSLDAFLASRQNTGEGVNAEVFKA